MITYLKVRNLAIVEEFAIEPGPGLNVLTGETGAGKSLLIDSLEFLGGSRGSTEAIRSGTDRMSAEAIFVVPGEAAAALRESGIEALDGDSEIELIVRREMAEGGRGRVLVNGSPLTVRELSKAMERIIDIHGQNEVQDRIAGRSTRELLDEYADASPALEEIRSLYGAWKESAEMLATMAASERDRAARIDLLTFQIGEITSVRPTSVEEETLVAERAILANASELMSATAGAFALLEEDEASALDLVGRAEHLLEPLEQRIVSVGQALAELREVRYTLQEVARTLASIGGDVRHDPERLEEVEERLVALDRLKKKYGGSIEAVLDHLSKATEEHERLTDYEANLQKTQKREEAAFDRFASAARALSDTRRKAAVGFQSAIQSELEDLAMEGTTVVVSIGTSPSPESRLTLGEEPVAFGPEGFDRVAVLIAPNRGDEPRPMQRIASGGELSRIQLAIAAALFKQSRKGAAATLVFDEIDAGIGGRVAEVVGRKLRELAESNQVICVTHLPQIAGLGTTHFKVWKESSSDQTRARISRLEGDEERIEEIARMLGGKTVTDSARLHAAELLRSGRGAPPQARRKGRGANAVPHS